jgi:hypothetical protein
MDPRYNEVEAGKFFDMMAEKGVMKTPTARSRKFAIQKVLSVLEPSEKADLRNINRDDAVQRFVNKYSQQFHPDSLQTYAYRFNVGLDDFISWVDNPMGFRPATSQRAARTARASAEMIDRAATGRAAPHPNQEPPASSPPATTVPGLIAIPVPLPSGGVAQLYVPQKLTAADAERIAAMAKALAVGQKDG